MKTDIRIHYCRVKKGSSLNLHSILYTCINLDWSHYRALISVKDKQKRDFFQKQTVKENWTVERLQDVIRIYRLQLKDLTEYSYP